MEKCEVTLYYINEECLPQVETQTREVKIQNDTKEQCTNFIPYRYFDTCLLVPSTIYFVFY